MNDSDDKETSGATRDDDADVLELTNTVETTEEETSTPISMKDPEVSGAVEELLGENEDSGQKKPPSLPPLITDHWVSDVFDEAHLELVEERDDQRLEAELNFIADELALRQMDGSLLDLCCGSGQYTVELKRRGFDVVGLDQSRLALDWAKQRAKKASVNLKLVCGDMRSLDFDELFSRVLLWGHSIGYFGEEGDRQTLKTVADLLEPNGQLLLETLNRDFIRKELPYRNWWESSSFLVLEEVSFDQKSSHISVFRALNRKAEDERNKREYSLRVYSLHEITRMLEECGFSVKRVTGDIQQPGRFLGMNHRRMLLLAEKT